MFIGYISIILLYLSCIHGFVTWSKFSTRKYDCELLVAKTPWTRRSDKDSEASKPTTIRKYRQNPPQDRRNSTTVSYERRTRRSSNQVQPNGSNQIQSAEDLLDAMKIDDEERLQKVIARAGVASRREAERLIADGRVSVNGKLVTELGTKVKPRKDIILVDGRKIVLPDAKDIFWVAIHKPKDMLTTLRDSDDRDSIINIVPKAKELRLVPVGGLDRDATGLLLMTNDIGWIHPLTHPSFRHKARYEVVVNGLMSDENFEPLRSAVQLRDERFLAPPSQISILDFDKPNGLTLIDVAIEECFPNQIEKMMEVIGCEVIRVKRSEYATMKLKGIRRGGWRELTYGEINQLKEWCKSAVKNVGKTSNPRESFENI